MYFSIKNFKSRTRISCSPSGSLQSKLARLGKVFQTKYQPSDDDESSSSESGKKEKKRNVRARARISESDSESDHDVADDSSHSGSGRDDSDGDKDVIFDRAKANQKREEEANQPNSPDLEVIGEVAGPSEGSPEISVCHPDSVALTPSPSRARRSGSQVVDYPSSSKKLHVDSPCRTTVLVTWIDSDGTHRKPSKRTKLVFQLPFNQVSGSDIEDGVRREIGGISDKYSILTVAKSGGESRVLHAGDLLSTDYEMVECSLGKEIIEEAAEGDEPSEDKEEKLKLWVQDGKDSRFAVSIGKCEPLQRLIDQYCAAQKLNGVGTRRFEFEGEEIDVTSTAGALGLEDEDCIDVTMPVAQNELPTVPARAPNAYNAVADYEIVAQHGPSQAVIGNFHAALLAAAMAGSQAIEMPSAGRHRGSSSYYRGRARGGGRRGRRGWGRR